MFSRNRARSENILILGLGGVGFYLAKRLVHEGYAVTAIEPDHKMLQYTDGQIDARLIHGSAMNKARWEEAGAGNMDYLIAVTDNDAVNMLSAMIGHEYGIPRQIARVRSTDFTGENPLLDPKKLHIDLIIHPEELAAQEIVRLIKINAGNEIIDAAEGKLRVMAHRVSEESPLAGKNLKEIARIHHDFPFRVVAIARGITTIIPGGDNTIMPQDQVFIMAGAEDMPKVMNLTGVKQDRRFRVMILGGGLVGSRVAELLEGSVRLKLIEQDEERAEELTNLLRHTEVLHGDGSDANVLNMAGLVDMDTFITTTGDNETNIMSCVLAKHLMNSQGVNGNGGTSGGKQRKTIAMVNNEDYVVLAATIGSDIALNRKILAGNEILKFIRRGEILSVAHLHGFDAEVVELVAAAGSPITKKPLSKLDPAYQGQILVGGVFRDGEWNIGVGDTQIIGGDRVIVVCASLQLKDVQKLFLA